MLSVGAVDSPSDGSGLTGSGVRRGTSVGSGVGVASGSALSDGASVAGAGVAGGVVAGACVAGASVAGCEAGACVVGAVAGVRLPAVRAAETTKALPAAASEAITRPKAVANAATGRITRARTPWRRPFWASARTSGTMRAESPAGATGAGMDWSAATIPLRESTWATHEEQVLRCA